MKAELQIQRVEDCMQWLESSAHDYTATQSISWLIDHVGQLCNTLAFVNNQMAVSKKILNDKKVTAYRSLITSEVANEKYFAPSLAKDFIAAQCSEEQYAYDLCERTSRTVTHILEILRSVLSALKEESKQLFNNKNTTL
jgi:hypothetical protein